MSGGGRLAWKVTIVPPGLSQKYDVLVDAATGEILYRRNRVRYIEGFGKVLQSDAAAGVDARLGDPWPIGSTGGRRLRPARRVPAGRQPAHTQPDRTVPRSRDGAERHRAPRRQQRARVPRRPGRRRAPQGRCSPTAGTSSTTSAPRTRRKHICSSCRTSSMTSFTTSDSTRARATSRRAISDEAAPAETRWSPSPGPMGATTRPSSRIPTDSSP